jgi:hypothetical protein
MGNAEEKNVLNSPVVETEICFFSKIKKNKKF